MPTRMCALQKMVNTGGTSEYKAKIRVPCSLTFSRNDTAALANPSQFLRAKRWSSGGSSKAAADGTT
jgi:hypothetical protein